MNDQTVEVEQLRAALRNACKMIVIQKKIIQAFHEAKDKMLEIDHDSFPGAASIAVIRLVDGASADWDIAELAAANIEETLWP